ncbi:GNAT family N-acetyltransferase [Lysinibacillus sp. NPDC097195]|uniref:GNAT family N-acetyltransferase n=1 Tax=Lysinibacillus sp. NPDC097195 TaxID=3364141 RepID=UPI0037FDF14C
MGTILAGNQHAQVVHKVMLQAFQEYATATPPSSALSETVESIEQAFNTGEQALISYMEDQPVAMVRFTVSEKGIYFFRLSVIPEMQGRGLAKALLNELENYARAQGKKFSECKVRMNVPRNIELYRSLGYVITKETMAENRNGFSLPIVTMEKEL